MAVIFGLVFVVAYGSIWLALHGSIHKIEPAPFVGGTTLLGLVEVMRRLAREWTYLGLLMISISVADEISCERLSNQSWTQREVGAPVRRPAPPRLASSLARQIQRHRSPVERQRHAWLSPCQLALAESVELLFPPLV